MGTREQLRNEIDEIPEPLVAEILDFVRFLKQRAAIERMESASASESTLKKDWLKPEEDEAWQHL